MLDEHPVVARIIGVTYHCLHRLLGAMIITFMISLISSFIQISIYVYGTLSIIGLRDMYGYKELLLIFDDLHIVIGQDIGADLIAI